MFLRRESGSAGYANDTRRTDQDGTHELYPLPCAASGTSGRESSDAILGDKGIPADGQTPLAIMKTVDVAIYKEEGGKHERDDEHRHGWDR